MLRSVWYKVALIVMLPTMPMASWAVGMASNQSETESKDRLVESSATEAAPKQDRKRIFTGFSGGMLVHLGYGFAHNPSELFRNGTLDAKSLRHLPKDGVNLGIGGQMRFHLVDHFRIGAEGYVSTMPLRRSGQIRTGWGGILTDAYLNWGPVQPFIGVGIGGGSMRRTYVDEAVRATAEGDETIYNASYTKSPFFYLDPTIGLEFGLTKRINMIIRADYLLPFSAKEDGLRASMQQIKGWKGLVTPTGPRLYVGFMFKH